MWQKLLQLQFAPNPREVLDWMLNQGVGATLAAYGGDPRQAEIAVREGALAVTRWTERAAQRHAGPARALPAHGGAPPRRLYRRSSPALRLRPASIPSVRSPSRTTASGGAATGFARLDQPYGDFVRVVRGYDRSQGGPASGPYSATIDAGCGLADR